MSDEQQHTSDVFEVERLEGETYEQAYLRLFGHKPPVINFTVLLDKQTLAQAMSVPLKQHYKSDEDKEE